MVIQHIFTLDCITYLETCCCTDTNSLMAYTSITRDYITNQFRPPPKVEECQTFNSSARHLFIPSIVYKSIGFLL